MPAGSQVAVVVCARNEADRLGGTLAALKRELPGARLIVADDASSDATPHVALQAAAELVRARSHLGKGGVATRAVLRLLEPDATASTLLICDGDLGDSAGRLTALIAAIEEGAADVAVAAFARPAGGGLGIAVGFARWALGRLSGLRLTAPISGQRALRAEVLPAVLPFAPGFGMELAMTVDAHRAGFRIGELELELEHRPTGRDAAGFAHRGRQLLAFARVYISRR